MDWLTVAIQAGGAIGVCGMFLWFLNRKQAADDAARDKFLEHQSTQNKQFVDHLSQRDEQQLAYLRDRDKQSRDVAAEGYKALREVAGEIKELREDMIRSDMLKDRTKNGALEAKAG